MTVCASAKFERILVGEAQSLVRAIKIVVCDMIGTRYPVGLDQQSVTQISDESL